MKLKESFFFVFSKSTHGCRVDCDTKFLIDTELSFDLVSLELTIFREMGEAHNFGLARCRATIKLNMTVGSIPKEVVWKLQ